MAGIDRMAKSPADVNHVHAGSATPSAATSNPQAALEVCQPSDPREREADRLAERVMRMATGAEPTRSRCCGDDEVSRSVTGSTPGAGRHVERSADLMANHMLRGDSAQIEGSRSPAPTRNHAGGAPLPASVRAFFEPKLGQSLANLRVHDSPGSHHAARVAGARAFVKGSSIYFGEGEYAPDTGSGRALLAHELAHVAQVRAGTADPSALHRQLAPPPPALSPSLIQSKLILRMCRNQVTRALVERIRADRLRIVLFDTAFDTWREADGSTSRNELRGLRGNTCVNANRYCPQERTIRLRKSLSIETMMMTLLHEMQHWLHSRDPAGPTGLESEIQARIATEQFAIDTGRMPTHPDYRTPTGEVDEAAIRADMRSSPHYSPVRRTRIGRSYVGEEPMSGTWACPPIGDFPDPGRFRNFA